jgi:hypothetical protein
MNDAGFFVSWVISFSGNVSGHILARARKLPVKRAVQNNRLTQEGAPKGFSS